jgi:hypothetical protein
VLLRNLPPGSATWAAVHGVPIGWGYAEILLADLVHVMTGEEHPLKPKPASAAAPAKAAALLAQRERLLKAAAPPNP